MDTPIQGQPAQEPAAPQGQPVQPEPAGLSPEELQRYGVQEPAPAPAALQGQPEGQPLPTTDDSATKHWQSLYNQTYAQMLALQQQYQQTLAQQQQQPQYPAPANQPAPDPQQDPVGYLDWKMQQQLNALRQELPKALQQQNQQWIQGLVEQAQEQQFAQTHPDIPLNAVKAWGQANGVTNLEHAYTLMTLPQRTAGIAQTVQNQTIQNFTKPQVGAQPVRPQGSVNPPSVQLSYERMYQDYVANNGSPAWSKELMGWFMTETNKRAQR